MKCLRLSSSILASFAVLAVCAWLVTGGFKKTLSPDNPKMTWRQEQLYRFFHGEEVARKNAWWLDTGPGHVTNLLTPQFQKRIGVKFESPQAATEALFQNCVIKYLPPINGMPRENSPTTEQAPTQPEPKSMPEPESTPPVVHIPLQPMLSASQPAMTPNANDEQAQHSQVLLVRRK